MVVCATPHPFPLSARLGALAGDLGCFPLDYEAYPPQSHCRANSTGIRSLADFSKLVGPLGHPVLYLRYPPHDAAPKCISGRTSYHGVSLSFHPYPQLIPQVFNPGGFGPPRGLTRASTWPWVDHSASGLEHATTAPYSDSLSLRLPHTG